MKIKKYKSAALLAAVMLMQPFGELGVVKSFAESASYPVYFDFETGRDGWNLGESKGEPSLERITENKNSYLRLSAKEGAAYNYKDGINAIPNVYVELASPFKMSANSEVVISADVRTDSIETLVRSFMLNRDQLEGEAADNTQYNLATLWAWDKNNKVNTYEQNNTRKIGIYNQTKANEAFRNLLESDAWYNFKTTLYTDADGFAKSLKLSVTKGGEEVFETQERSISADNKALKLSDKITRLDMALFNINSTAIENAVNLDFDNVRIYTVTNDRTWGIKSDDENNVLIGKESVDIAFDGEMDEESINDKTVKLYDADENEVEYSSVYDKKTFVYTITPTSGFKSGKYRICVDKANINGIKPDGEKIFGLSENAKTSEEFIIFNGTLPEAKNVYVSGRIEKGEILKANAEYYQAEGIPGKTKIEWYYSDSGDGEYAKIDGADSYELTVTEDLSDKYVKISAYAVTDDGIRGKTVSSTALKPLMKPYAKDVTVSGLAMAGFTVTLDYTFCDDNGDSEAESVYSWYISANGKDGWEKITGACEKSYLIGDSDVGKYLMASVIPVSDDAPYEGDEQKSQSFGPITGTDTLNVIKNPGFETGDTTGWGVRNAAGDSATITATDADSYSGKWCGVFEGQTSNSTFLAVPAKLEANTAYIFSMMLKLTPDCAFDNATVTYYGEGHPSDLKKDGTVQYALSKDEWKRISTIVTTGNAATISFCPQFWANGASGYSVYLDDFYVAPLLVDDIITTAPTEMNIPTSGETSAVIGIKGIRNNVGSDFGLENEKAYFELDKSVKGAYISGDKLYVTDKAVGGTLNLKAVCEPSFKGAKQSRYVKNIPIKLIANDNKTPRVDSAVLSGDTSSGGRITLSYDFYQVDGEKDCSEVKYYISESENGEYKETDMGDKNGIDVSEEFKNKFIKAVITPIDSKGHEGTAVTSNIAGPARAPVARNIRIDGKGYVGETVKVSYDYYDFNGDKEGKTVFKWKRAASENGEYKEIIGADKQEYTVTLEDKDSYIRCEVTPVSQKSPFEGETAISNVIMGPCAPVAKNLTITVSGKTLVGDYEYESKNGIGEGDTKLEWLIGGNVVGTGATYDIDFSGTQTVEFRVTPVAIKEPATGKSVSVTKSVSGRSGGNSGGGTGGSHGGVVSGTILPSVEDKNDKPSDIDNHWSKEYAQYAVENNIMSMDENNNFYPDKLVTRAEFITYIFKTMGYSETEYKNEFSDVSASERYAKMLQTLVDKGIISHDVNFRPNDNISRQEVAKVLSIILELKNNGNELDGYTDVDKIGTWAVEYVKNVIASGIMKGVSQTEFSPRTNITNGQMAKIVMMIQKKN